MDNGVLPEHLRYRVGDKIHLYKPVKFEPYGVIFELYEDFLINDKETADKVNQLAYVGKAFTREALGL